MSQYPTLEDARDGLKAGGNRARKEAAALAGQAAGIATKAPEDSDTYQNAYKKAYKGTWDKVTADWKAPIAEKPVDQLAELQKTVAELQKTVAELKKAK